MNETAPEYSDFITISEAAEVLGVSERQARRYAKRLPDGDRLRPDTATGATVARVRRVSIIEAYHDATGRKVEREAMDTATDTTTGALEAQAGHEAGHHDQRGEDERTRDREEIIFLRGLVEQHQRSEAELRAALREALRAMPKAIEAGSGSTPTVAREDAPQRDESAPMANYTGKSAKSSPRRPQREMRPLWKVILGIR